MDLTGIEPGPATCDGSDPPIEDISYDLATDCAEIVDSLEVNIEVNQSPAPFIAEVEPNAPGTDFNIKLEIENIGRY